MAKRLACKQHPDRPAVARCQTCGQGICAACRRTYGYFCSQACKNQAQREREAMETQQARAQRAQAHERSVAAMQFFTRRVVPAAVLLLAAWIAVRLASDAGKTMWTFHPEQGGALSGLTLQGKTLYVATHTGNVHALDPATGKELWRVRAGQGLDRCLPKVLAQGSLLVWSENSLYCVRTREKSVSWQHAVEGQLDQPPVAADDVLCYVSSTYKPYRPQPGQQASRNAFRGAFSGVLGANRELLVRDKTVLRALDAAAGGELWSRPLDGPPAAEALAAHKGLLFLGQGGMPTDAAQDALLALDLRSGDGQWKAQIEGGRLTGLHADAQGLVLSTARKLYALTPGGQKQWEHPHNAGQARAQVGPGHVLLRDAQDGLVCLNRASGQVLWTAAISDRAGEPVLGPRRAYVPDWRTETIEQDEEEAPIPAWPQAPGIDVQELAGDQDFTLSRSISRLHAIDLKAGDTLWVHEEIGGHVVCGPGGPVVARVSSPGGLLTLGRKGVTHLCGLEPDDGGIAWTHKQEGFLADAVLTDKLVLFTIHQGRPDTMLPPVRRGAAGGGGHTVHAVSRVW